MAYDQCGIPADQGGRTALMISSIKGHRECLSILLAHDAAVDKANTVSVAGL